MQERMREGQPKWGRLLVHAVIAAMSHRMLRFRHRQLGREMIIYGLCLLVAVFFSSCVSSMRTHHRTFTQPQTSPDLLFQAREWRQKEGLVVARDRLQVELGKRDDSKQEFEKRIWKTNADKGYVFADSVRHLSPLEKSQTGIYMVLGYQQKQGRSPPIIRAAAAELRRQGFHAVSVVTPDRASSEENAEVIAALLRKESPQMKRIIFVGFSKGASDVFHFLSGPLREFPAEERAKVRLVVNCAGVLRGSCVADWAAHDHDPNAYLLRTFLNLRSRKPFATFEDLDSISRDPWQEANFASLRNVTPNLHSISFPALPEGPDGRTHSDAFFSLLGRWCEDKNRKLGPCDGLVETAASILPLSSETPQWIVRVRGSHALLDGHYLNGANVAPSYPFGKKGQLASGMEFMNDLTRALPKSVIGL